MAQSLVNLFGAAGAARFLQLAAAPVRYPCDSLQILNQDRSLNVDLTHYLDSVSIDQSDVTNKSELTTYTITNPNGYFDEYGGGGGSGFLAMDTLIQYKKGLIDMTAGSPTFGTRFLVPAAFGSITKTRRVYDRNSDLAVQISALDLFKKPLKRKVSTDQYLNQLPNTVATDVAERYMGFAPQNIILANTGSWPAYPIVQCPDMTPVDILEMLYQPLNYFVRVDEAGNLTSGPRLGSALSGFAGLLGYPDQLTQPAAAAVAYVIPDNLSVISVSNDTQDYEFYNQVRAIGNDLPARTTLGLQQLLFKLSDSSIDAITKIQQPYTFSQSSASSNELLAENVIVVFRYSTTHNLDSAPQFMCFSADGNGILPPGVPAGTPIYAVNSSHPDVQNSDPHSVGYLAVSAVTLTDVVVKIEGRQYSSGGGLFGGGVRHHGGFDYNMQIWGNPLVSYTKTLTAYVDYNTQTVLNLAMPAFGTAFGAGQVPYGDIFNDHQTYQLPQAPIAKGTTVEVQINPSTLPSTTLSAAAAAGDQKINLASLANLVPGICFRVDAGAGLEYVYIGDQPAAGYSNPVAIAAPLNYAHAAGATAVGLTGASSADGEVLSNVFKVDWERGRIGLLTLLYRNFAEDDAASHPASSTMTATAISQYGGFTASTAYAVDNSVVFDYSALATATPSQVYMTQRRGDTQYLFTGLVPGQSYDVRLHFADDEAFNNANGSIDAQAGKTVFSVYSQQAPVLTDFDIFVAAGGARIAVQQIVSGQVADLNGNITLWITQHDPYSGQVLPGSRGSDWTLQNGHTRGIAQCCAVELLPSQGKGAPPYAVNSGGPAINPAVPTVLISYGWSPNQQEYQIQMKDIDDPLVQTHAQLVQMAQYALNQSAWARNTQTIEVSSLPWLQPGDLIQYYVRKLNKDFWGYIPAIKRSNQRPKKGSQNGSTDKDTITTFVLYAKNRL